MSPTICPKSRKKCEHIEVCWLMFCARSGHGPKLRPISERELTTAEKYELAMQERKNEQAAQGR